METIDTDGKVPSSRFKDANSCREVFQVLFKDDELAASKRAKNQEMFDGAAPMAPSPLERAGQKHRTNVSTGEAEDILEDAKGAYIDMLQSVETLFHAPTKFGATADERKRYAKGVCRAVSGMIKRWPQFFHQYMLNATNFISQGVSFAVFPDDIDWRFIVKGLSDVYVPRDSDATEDGFEVVFMRDSFTVSRLYRSIANEDVAKELGWNVKAVKELLKKSSHTGDQTGANRSWEDYATLMKTDDLKISTKSKSIEMLFCMVKEFDGTVTQYILPVTGDKEFLFAKRGKYQSMVEALVLFAYSVGNKGKLYEIRGLGTKIYSLIKVYDRMFSHGVDGSMLASSMMVRPRSMSDIGKAQLAFQGPYTVVHPGSDIVETSHPNFAQNTGPIVQATEGLLRKKSGGYTSSRALPDGGEMSQFEASARISNAAGMTVTNLILFLEQFEKLLRQIVRRIQRKDYNEDMPGGEMIVELYEELAESGIPIEALYELDTRKLKATRPVGAGSPAARENAFRKLREWSPGFDEEGQRNLTRDGVADIIGSYEGADDYLPPAGVERKAEGTKLAMLENFALRDGEDVEVFSEEFHISHLEVHTAYMMAFIEQTQQGQLKIEEAYPIMQKIHEHAARHLEEIEGDPMSQADAARFRQVLQQSGEIITNGFRKLQSMQQKAMEQEGVQGQEQQPSEQESKAAMQLRIMAEKHQVTMEIIRAKAEQDAQIAMMKANTAARIAETKAISQLSPYSLSRQG